MTRHHLSEEHIRHFRTEGFVVAPSLFAATEFTAINSAIEELTERAFKNEEPDSIMEFESESIAGRPVARRIYNPFDQHEAFRTLATDDRILDRIESLIGADFNLQHSKLNMKPAGVGSPG